MPTTATRFRVKNGVRLGFRGNKVVETKRIKRKRRAGSRRRSGAKRGRSRRR